MTYARDGFTQAERHLRHAEEAAAELGATSDLEEQARILDDVQRSLALAEAAIDRAVPLSRAEPPGVGT